MKLLLKTAILFSYITFTTPLAFSKDLVSSFDFLQNETMGRYNIGSEYMSGQDTGTVMMKVNLWGAVKKPGIHHIPIKTDLISLISYAGGPNDNADLEDVVIKRNYGEKQKKINIDVSQIIHSQKKYDLTLQPEDVIVVPAEEPLINKDTFVIASFTATILTAIFTAVLIKQQND